MELESPTPRDDPRPNPVGGTERRVDVSGLRAERVVEFVGDADGAAHVERRGSRTFVVTDG